MSLHRPLIVVATCWWVFGTTSLTPCRGQLLGPPASSRLPDDRLLEDRLLEDRPWEGRLREMTSRQVIPSRFDGRAADPDIRFGRPKALGDPWCWQMLPDGLMYPAYLASGRESRFSSHWMHEQDKEWLWDAALGARVGLLRYGTTDLFWPEGWQLDVEGAAFPRMTLDWDRDMVATDYRGGIPLTFRRGPLETKFGFYHLSSHIADEYTLKNPTFERLNYVRDTLVAGIAVRPWQDLRLYVEAGWAFKTDGGSEPWEFQFGVDYSPVRPTHSWPDPFIAVNGRIREEVGYGGNVTVQTGLQWRNRTGGLFRLGMHYLNGKTDQYQFFREHEQQIGLGAWYDF